MDFFVCLPTIPVDLRFIVMRRFKSDILTAHTLGMIGVYY
jgi:hypothetical protein